MGSSSAWLKELVDTLRDTKQLVAMQKKDVAPREIRAKATPGEREEYLIDDQQFLWYVPRDGDDTMTVSRALVPGCWRVVTAPSATRASYVKDGITTGRVSRSTHDSTSCPRVSQMEESAEHRACYATGTLATTVGSLGDGYPGHEGRDRPSDRAFVRGATPDEGSPRRGPQVDGLNLLLVFGLPLSTLALWSGSSKLK